VTLPWVAVMGLGAWSPGLPDVRAHLTGAPVAGAEQPSVRLPARLRRRTSLLTRMIVDVAYQAAEQAQRPLGELPLVMGSAYGELGTTMEMLEELEGDRQLSPFRFHNSVHNTAIGYLSMATENQRPATALAAGNDTTAAALLEGLAWLAERGGEVLVVVADEGLPAALARRSTSPLAAAVLLRAAAPASLADTRALAWLGELAQAKDEEPGAPRAAEVDCPGASMLSLVKAAAAMAGAQEARRVGLSAGERAAWSVSLAAAPPWHEASTP